MKVNISTHIKNTEPLVKKLVSLLNDTFDGVSVLATDCEGKKLTVGYAGTQVEDGMLAERGYVARVYNGENYTEHSFNELSESTLTTVAERIKTAAINDVAAISAAGIPKSRFPKPVPFGKNAVFEAEVKILPSSVSTADKIRRMSEIMESGRAYNKDLVDFRVIYNDLTISKAFYTKDSVAMQAYTFATANVLALVEKDGNMQYEYNGVSGNKGVEVLDELAEIANDTIDQAVELLSADRVVPGTYDIICDPNVTGLIAHEAFGHGVEMDMFVKARAKGAEYMDKAVASDILDMRDGATSAENVATFLFDDEGILGTDTKIIENGILKAGISDLFSAIKLNTTPTGNGRRQSFERKAYARMTNTFFSPGKDKLDDMIASIKHGYLLENYKSGMEDPKNWGIQCMISKGREIKDGKFTGKIVAPVLMTGYVPDVLKSITAVSDDELYLNGSGHCGKGYKEWMKTSIGGTYIKLRGRLG